MPAMVTVDALVRLIPGVLREGSAEQESFMENLLDYPHYTRPREFMGWTVPEPLLSGNHKLIERWRKEESRAKTAKRRPDLLNSPPEAGQGEGRGECLLMENRITPFKRFDILPNRHTIE